VAAWPPGVLFATGDCRAEHPGVSQDGSARCRTGSFGKVPPAGVRVAATTLPLPRSLRGTGGHLLGPGPHAANGREPEASVHRWLSPVCACPATGARYALPQRVGKLTHLGQVAGAFRNV